MASPKKFKVLFVTSELYPFVKTGGLADVSAALPLKLTELGHEVRILVPKYGAIDSRRYKIHDVVRLKDIPLKIGEKETLFSVKSSFLPTPKLRVQIYFLDNQEYFGNRKSLYTDPVTGQDYADNDERFILLSRAIFELVHKLGWIPDIIHCNDWQCGLAPAYFKNVYANIPELTNCKLLFTIHNLLYQGTFSKDSFSKTGLPQSLATNKGLLHNDSLNFMKAGLMYADCINTVSEGYAKEILHDKELSGGLNKIIESRKNVLYGMVNGIDDSVWNPEKDPYIPYKYTYKTIQFKEQNKEVLTQRFEWKNDETIPVIGMISRLYESKGIDILLEAFPKLMELNLRFVLLGTGEKKYHQQFEKLAMKYPDKFVCYLGFNDELAHLIEAGADLFLMPSKYEPCGLNQMYSLVYGTVPIVRETGGLADTVKRWSDKSEDGTGFMFKQYTSEALLKEITRALHVYQDKKIWNKIIRNGMKSDFSWTASAKSYIDLYRTIVNG